MDNLEPWNMFTNNMVAEETDEILTDDMVSEYQVGGGASAATCTAPILVPQIKEEPQDTHETDNENADDDERTATDFISDDNTIFNFGLESPLDAKVAERSTPSMTTRSQRMPQTPSRLSGGGGGAYCKHEDDSNAINYESGVVYICPACGAEFNAQDAWKRHMNGVHNFNTRIGLNFVQLDRLYHECLECNKRIAMHAMENLLKHKFTHLPYRCTKCKVCLRQYKYRQDLIVHLRTTHRDDLIVLAKHDGATESDLGYRNGKTTTSEAILAIKDIKENAIDIFESTIEVKNELIEPDDDTAAVDAHQHNDIDRSRGSSFALPSFLEEALHGNVSRPSSGNARETEDLCERYIQYICPQCVTEYGNQTQWRQHIEHVHDFGTRKGLNFKEVHMNQHAQCLECNKLIYVNVIRNLQLHKFTHLPHKTWLRCKLCFRQFISHKDLIKHLTQQHRLGGEFEGGDAADDSQDQDSRLDDEEAKPNGGGGGGGGFGDDQDLSQSSKFDERDSFEPHIEYLCPQCGREFREKKMWRKHIVKVHHLTDLHVLNFKVINERQVECLECRKIITNAYGVQNAQQHRITHMPYKAYIRCRLCAKSYTDRKGLVKHLNSVHRVGRDSMSLSMSPFTAPLTMSSSRSSLAMPPSKAPLHKRQPQCEIVQHEHYTYEIKYLDDDDGDEDAAMAWSMDDDNAAVPELLEYGNYSKQRKYLECGSSFETQRTLHEHRRRAAHEFHELRVYGRGRGRGVRKGEGRTVPRSNQSLDEISNCTNSDNDDELLVPTTGDESQNSIDTTPIIADVGAAAGGSDNIEDNFCYLCPACGVEYKRQIDWRTHINTVHHFDHRAQLNFRPLDRFRYQCKLCGDIVSNSKLKGLQDHKFRHLPYKLYIKCLLCGTCYNHKPNMISHLRQRHSISSSSGCADIVDSRRTSDSGCDYGARQLVSRPGTISYSAAMAPTKPPGLKTVEDCISFHNAVDHDSITYFCPQCNKNFDTHVFWRKHIVEEHNLNCKEGLNFRQIDVHHYLCLECYKRVTVTHTKGAIGQLQSHKFRHLPYRSFKCLACNGLFVRKQMFFKHLNRATYHCDTQPQAPPSADDDADDSEYSARILQPEAVYGNGRGGAASGDVTRQNAETFVANSSGSVGGGGGSGGGGGGGGGGRGDAFLDLTCFLLLCPQCGIQNESWRSWREHINIAHNLGKREHLNLRRLSTSRHQCRQCLEHVNGNKLRDLQIHKFKHLPFGSFLQCKLCSAAYQRLQGIQNHLQHKHPNAMRKYAKFDQLEHGDDENSGTQNETTDADYADNATEEMTDARMEQQHDANADDEDNDDEADGDDTIDNDVDEEEEDEEDDDDGDEDDQDDMMDNENNDVIAVKAENPLHNAVKGCDPEMEIEALDEDDDNDDDDVADDDHNDMVEGAVPLEPPHELPQPDEQYLLG